MENSLSQNLYIHTYIYLYIYTYIHICICNVCIYLKGNIRNKFQLSTQFLSYNLYHACIYYYNFQRYYIVI